MNGDSSAVFLKRWDFRTYPRRAFPGAKIRRYASCVPPASTSSSLMRCTTSLKSSTSRVLSHPRNGAVLQSEAFDSPASLPVFRPPAIRELPLYVEPLPGVRIERLRSMTLQKWMPIYRQDEDSHRFAGPRFVS